MLFVLPFVAAAISAGQAAAGCAAAVGMAVTAKGLYDMKKADDIRDVAAMKISGTMKRLVSETQKVKKSLSEFGRLKMRSCEFALSEIERLAVACEKTVEEKLPLPTHLRSLRARDMIVSARDSLTESLLELGEFSVTLSVRKDIGTDTADAMAGAFGFAYDDLHEIVTRGAFLFAADGAERLTKAHALLAAADVNAEEADTKIGFCKSLLRLVCEGESLLSVLTNRLSDMSAYAEKHGDVSERLALFECAARTAGAIGEIAATDLCSREWQLLDAAGILYSKIKREVAGGEL